MRVESENVFKIGHILAYKKGSQFPLALVLPCVGSNIPKVIPVKLLYHYSGLQYEKRAPAELVSLWLDRLISITLPRKESTPQINPSLHH